MVAEGSCVYIGQCSGLPFLVLRVITGSSERNLEATAPGDPQALDFQSVEKFFVSGDRKCGFCSDLSDSNDELSR